LTQTILKLLAYKSWANGLTFNSLFNVTDEELYKERETSFKTILHTLNHVFVVDDIFRHHLTGKPHGYTFRNTEEVPTLSELWKFQQEMDLWYESFAQELSGIEFNHFIEFEFVGGGKGRMNPEEIFLHIVNHGTYHRGFVSDMMYQIPVQPPANDFTIFVRDSIR